MEECLDAKAGGYPGDKKGLLSLPDSFVCNPSVCPKYLESKGWPLLIRVRQKANNSYGEISVVKRGYLATPTEVIDYRVLIDAAGSHSRMGREDARFVAHEGTYYITSVGWDGRNARVILDTTSDLKTVRSHGVISAEIPVREAMEVMGDEFYKEYYFRRFGKASSQDLEGLLIHDKDAALEFFPNGKVGFWHRWEPGIQLSVADSVEEFRRKDYWIDQLNRIGEITLVWPGANQRKVGLGGPPIKIDGRFIGTHHYLEAFESDSEDRYRYYGSFFEFDPASGKIVSILKDPLFVPTGEDLLIERHGNKTTTKEVKFPTAMIEDPENGDVLWVYYGIGDKKIGWRTLKKSWLLGELSHEHNRIDVNESREIAA